MLGGFFLAEALVLLSARDQILSRVPLTEHSIRFGDCRLRLIGGLRVLDLLRRFFELRGVVLGEALRDVRRVLDRACELLVELVEDLFALGRIEQLLEALERLVSKAESLTQVLLVLERIEELLGRHLLEACGELHVAGTLGFDGRLGALDEIAKLLRDRVSNCP